MTGWPAYGMLAFHLYRWNQLKVIPMACRLRTRSIAYTFEYDVSSDLHNLKNLTAELYTNLRIV